MTAISLILEGVFLIAGAISGFLLAALVLVPLFFGFPLSLLWTVAGWARWYAPLLYFIKPLLWGLAFSALWFVLLPSAPESVRKLLWSQGFALGNAGGLIWALARESLSKYMRDRRKEKFIKFMFPHLTDVGQANAVMRGLVGGSR